MRRLFLLRHAMAMPAERLGGDKERELSPRGAEDAKALGAFMAKKNYLPDYVLCSPALRTKQTLHGLMQSLGKTAIDYEDILYSGGAGDLLYQIQKTDNSKSNVLLVAHNPSIQELGSLLCGYGGQSLITRMIEGFKPAALAVLSCTCLEWKDIQPAENEITDFQDPLDFNAPSTPARWT